jgi:hypothetical protein
MLAGFRGNLISESFLERGIAERGRTADEANLRRVLQRWRQSCQELGPASSLRALVETGAEPLATALGFTWTGPLVPLKNSLGTTIGCSGEPVALVCSAWGDPLGAFWRAGIEHSARIGAAWCLFFNGTHLRLVHARHLYARRHAEFDVDLTLDSDGTFQAFAMVMTSNAFATRVENTACLLQVAITASERHREGVCGSLRAGVFQASTDLLAALVARRTRVAVDAAFEQALILVYRILFLLFAEARNLVPLWHPVYRSSYSLESLCDIAERGRSSAGLWDAIRAVSALAHSGCQMGDLKVTAFNGRLFAPARTPLVERRDLDDEAAKRALLALSTRASADRQGRERIAYQDLGVEELGAVYESLLDYRPNSTLALRAGTGLRKATGTFYTPRGIAEYLARRALAPLVQDAPPEHILALKVLDPSMGSGAFLVAACSFLAHAYETALVERGGCQSSDFGPRERASIRRLIAERCLFGVDLNPMAVQLARLSLWLTTLAADRPLTFLDHHLVAGDSVLGAWLSSLRSPPVAARRRQAATRPLFEDGSLSDTMRLAVPARFALETPNDTVGQVRDKERALASLNGHDTFLSRWKRVADLWCAGWFAGADEPPPAMAFRDLSDAVLSGRSALPSETSRRYIAAGETIAAAQRFLHWELEFPEVFFDASGNRRVDGGFDAILGNPPWDMLRADSGPTDELADARRAASAVVRFTRDSGVYVNQSDGHANRYQLFVERALELARPRGRIGLVLPAGFAVDHGSAPLRRRLFARCDVDALVGFENSARIFPIHRSVRFHLLTATSGPPTVEFGCRLGERDPRILEAAPDQHGDDEWFPVRVTPALLERVSGCEMAVPDFRTALDVAIAERATALFAPLGDQRGWSVRFGRELNATDDRAAFRPHGRGLPVVEGKQIEPFRADVGAARHAVSRRDLRARFADGRYDRARLAYRDVAGATNRLTLIAAVLPRGCVSTHTVFCLRTPLAAIDQHFLCGMFNSFVVNYLARQRVSTHVTTAIVERLPIPTAASAPDTYREIAAWARYLARRTDPAIAARLQARVARLYQLSTAEFCHVLATFPLVPKEDRDAALGVFRTL